MTKLWTVAAEVRRVLRRVPADCLQALRAPLLALCETHWEEMRGPEPPTGLARALWGIPPHLADLFVRLDGTADPRLAALFDGVTPQQALAVLVQAEIERGDAEGARAAYDAMQLFASPAAREVCVRSVLSAPAAARDVAAALKHAHRPPLWRAVTGITAHIGRWDAKAVVEALRHAAQAQAEPAAQAEDPLLQPILAMLHELGLTVLGVEADHLAYTVRGERQEPVRLSRIADMLAEGRQAQGL